MLGIRLDEELEAMLGRVALERGKSKSEIARFALRSYLERQDIVFRAELERQLKLLSQSFTAEDGARLDAAHDDLMRDEPDYDWGDKAA